MFRSRGARSIVRRCKQVHPSPEEISEKLYIGEKGGMFRSRGARSIVRRCKQVHPSPEEISEKLYIGEKGGMFRSRGARSVVRRCIRAAPPPCVPTGRMRAPGWRESARRPDGRGGIGFVSRSACMAADSLNDGLPVRLTVEAARIECGRPVGETLGA